MVFYKQLEKTFNIEQIKKEIESLVTQHGWWNDSQMSLQSPDGDFMNGNGITSVSSGTFEENTFDKLNIPNDWEIANFITHYNLFRTRIMKLNPKSCYSMHRDRTSRIHLPITTKEHCLMMINNESFHLPANGHAYYTETTEWHTALNAHLDFERIHIVGCVEKNLRMDDFK